MKKLLLPFVIVLTLCSTNSYGQDSYSDLGLELQIYPTGIIPGLRYAVSFNSTDEFHLRLGYQFIDHRDLGVQADEKGSGYGFTLGYRRYLNKEASAWSLGLRNDIWWNTIDWNSGEGSVPYLSGTTEIVVVQPTLEAAYTFLLGEGMWSLAPSLCFGYEVNVKTEGEPAGEGAILLIGASISKRF